MILHDKEYCSHGLELSPVSCDVIRLPPNERETLVKMVTEGLGLLQDVPDRTSKISHKIDTGDATPIHQRSYRYSTKVLKAIYTELDNHLGEGKVECSHSAWASP